MIGLDATKGEHAANLVPYGLLTGICCPCLPIPILLYELSLTLHHQSRRRRDLMGEVSRVILPARIILVFWVILQLTVFMFLGSTFLVALQIFVGVIGRPMQMPHLSLTFVALVIGSPHQIAASIIRLPPLHIVLFTLWPVRVLLTQP